MEKIFEEHFRMDDNETFALWKNAIFSLDTNVILNLYRYSEKTRKELIRILRSIEIRLWVSYQFGYEYFNNRLNTINSQKSKYIEIQKILKELQSSLNTNKHHPFVKTELLDDFNKIYEELSSEIETGIKSMDSLVLEDTILNEIKSLLKDKVGKEPSKDKLNEIFKIGKTRYENKTPPGYMDKSKDVVDQRRKYGDLIIWEALIDKSTELGKPIIFITAEKKEDWWHLFKGKTIGPRPELIKEFQERTGQGFYLYQFDSFLELSAKYLEQEIIEGTIEEVKEVSIDQELDNIISQLQDDLLDYRGKEASDDLEELNELYNRAVEKVDKLKIYLELEELKKKSKKYKFDQLRYDKLYELYNDWSWKVERFGGRIMRIEIHREMDQVRNQVTSD